MALYGIAFFTKYSKEVLLEKDSDKQKYFTFPEIDNITSLYKTSEDFCDKYINYERQYDMVRSAWLVKKSDSNIRRKLIFDDPFVHEISSIVLDQKSSKIDYNLMSDYIRYIKRLALDKDCIDSISNSYYIPQKLKLELENYHRLKNMENISSALFEDLNIVEREIENNLCNYTTFRQVVLWFKEFIITLNPDERDKYLYVETSVQNTESLLQEQNEAEDIFQKGPEDLISNSILREVYGKCDGDIELIIGILGVSFMDDVSPEDQKLAGYTGWKQRRY